RDGHAGCGFAGRDDRKRVRPFFRRIASRNEVRPLFGERALDERASVDRSHARPDEGQEMRPKIYVGTGQCDCLGSDQAESPVTTSNFLRSELTTCGALSWVDSCSSSARIFVSAASASVMALSE